MNHDDVILRLVGVTKRFDRTPVLQDVDLDVHDRQITVIIGISPGK